MVLLILDGFGCSLDKKNNAIAMAKPPSWDTLQKDCSMTLLNCSGNVAGLPGGQMDNSEVGHVQIGTGRYVRQDFSKVTLLAVNTMSLYVIVLIAIW
jgi:2,3-bisphosphoglycerate-independent phosphoglycerate mutase